MTGTRPSLHLSQRRATKLDAMILQEEPWDDQWIGLMVAAVPDDYRYPLALGLSLANAGALTEGLAQLKEARRRLLLEFETHPSSEAFLLQLSLLETDIADTEHLLCPPTPLT